MKRFAPVLLATGFVITLAGCTPPAPVSDATVAPANTSQATSPATSSELTLVTLKVPNMF